ncbi:MAG: DUF1189 family protein [Chloroflexota bacterium]|nr:DUF1189 family protein [Chloroflexota bacterium]
MNEIQSTAEQQSPVYGCLSELGWLGAGFVMPCASLTFYRRAARRKVIWAALFFLFFSLVITSLTTVAVGKTMFSVRQDIRRAFDTGGMPEITIRDGVATVDAEQPLVLFDEQRTIIMIDTNSTYRQIDRSRYSQGLLLTSHSLHLLDNNGRYQEIRLSDLNAEFGNPIIVSADAVNKFWIGFSAVTTVLAFLALVVWNALGRFVYLTMLALAIWGVISLFRRNTGFGQVLSTGLYAIVPAMYAHYLLGRLGVHFFTLQTILLLPVWAIALVAALVGPGRGFLRGERTLRGWRALIGAPMLLIFALDVIFVWPKGKFIVWSPALLTFVVLLAVGVWTARMQKQQEIEQPETYDFEDEDSANLDG